MALHRMTLPTRRLASLALILVAPSVLAATTVAQPAVAQSMVLLEAECDQAASPGCPCAVDFATRPLPGAMGEVLGKAALRR